MSRHRDGTLRRAAVRDALATGSPRAGSSNLARESPQLLTGAYRGACADVDQEIACVLF